MGTNSSVPAFCLYSESRIHVAGSHITPQNSSVRKLAQVYGWGPYKALGMTYAVLRPVLYPDEPAVRTRECVEHHLLINATQCYASICLPELRELSRLTEL